MTGKYEETFHELHGEVLYEERVDRRTLWRAGLRWYGLMAGAITAFLLTLALLSDAPANPAAELSATLAGVGGTVVLCGLMLLADLSAAPKNWFRLRSDGLEVAAPMSPHADTGPAIIEHGQIPYASMLWVGPLRAASRQRVRRQFHPIDEQGTMPFLFPLRPRWLVIYRGHEFNHAFQFQPSAAFAARLVEELKGRSEHCQIVSGTL